MGRFELPASCSQSRRATKLRHIPMWTRHATDWARVLTRLSVRSGGSSIGRPPACRRRSLSMPWTARACSPTSATNLPSVSASKTAAQPGMTSPHSNACAMLVTSGRNMAGIRSSGIVARNQIPQSAMAVSVPSGGACHCRRPGVSCATSNASRSWSTCNRCRRSPESRLVITATTSR